MELLLKRHFWLLPIFTIVACAYLAASTLSRTIDAALVTAGEPASRARAPKKRAAARPAPQKGIDDLVARNMFCSSCDPAAASPAGPAADDGQVRTTDLPLVLVATTRAAGALTATIRDTASARSGVYAEGDVIPDGGTIRRIRAQFVELTNAKSGRVERILLAATAATAAPAANRAAAAPPPAAPAVAGVKQVGENHFEIERGTIDRLLADPADAMQLARVAPAVENGHAVGFRLGAIRPASLLAQIGLKNGDQVRSINGLELTSPDRALEAYTKLRSASSLVVAVNRGGAPVNLEYTIR